MPYQEILGEAVEEEEGRAVAVMEAVDGYGGGEGDVEGGEIGEHCRLLRFDRYVYIIPEIGSIAMKENRKSCCFITISHGY